MNPLKYAIACRESYGPSLDSFIKGWFINGVSINLTRIDGDYVLVLRGSQTAEDWLRCLDNTPIFNEKLGWCHSGFITGLSDVFNSVRNCTGGEPVSFTGHSLGGARARLLAGIFIVNGLPVKNLVTFGSPKPAFNTLKEIIDNSNIYHVSFRNNEDIVPTLPETLPPVFDYVHPDIYQVIDAGQNDGIEGYVKDHGIDLYIKALQCTD